MLPHNSGEQWTALGKITLSLTDQLTLRTLGLHSEDQSLLYDQTYKYDLHLAPAQRLRGDLLTGHVQYASTPGRGKPLIADLRVGRFSREFLRGALSEEVDYALGGLTGRRFHFLGEDIARAQAGSTAPIPGLRTPELSAASPWGVPAFFIGSGSRGDLGWSRFGETRGQLDVTFGASEQVDLYAGAELTRQQVRTFQRALGYLPVGDSVPPTAVSTFSPASAAGYIEAQLRLADLAFTGGIRYDQFNAGSELSVESRGSQRRLSPRFAVSTVLAKATFVASYGRFTQAPDYQYLADAAFDDSTRTGRFRRGNPNIGFEDATQYEFSLRLRPTPITSLRLGVYVKRLDGLVASVPLGIDPDSTIFGNADAGSVKGAELLFERELQGGYGIRVAYTLQQATATATDAFLLNRLISIDPVTGDTIRSARAEFPLDYDRRHTATVILRSRVPDQTGPKLLGVRPLAGLESAAIVRPELGTAILPQQRGRRFATRPAERFPPARNDDRGSAGAQAAAARRCAWRRVPGCQEPAEPPEYRGRAQGHGRAGLRTMWASKHWRRQLTRRTRKRFRSSPPATVPSPTATVTATSKDARSCSRSTSRPHAISLSRSSRTVRPDWCDWEWSTSSDAERGLPSEAPG